MAVWEQYDGTRISAFANRYVAGTNSWGTAQLIETDNAGDVERPQVAVDSRGNAVAVWSQSDGSFINTMANRYVAGTNSWGTAQLIETDNTGDAERPQVAVDLNGDAVAVWQQYDGSRLSIMANRYVVASGWGTAQLLETDNAGNAEVPQVAVDSSGNAMVVWQQDDGAVVNLMANRYLVGTGWRTPGLLEADNAGNVEDPQVAVNGNGKAVAVWAQYDGSETNILANQYR